MINLNKLTDPQEFIAYYFNEIKTELEADNLSLSKVGGLGFLLNIMGNTQFDIKKYYDGLFNEAFPISSFNDVNLQQHSLTFGYLYDNAKASSLVGNILFDFLNLPPRSSAVKKREIKLIDISFMVGDLNFILESDYTIIIDIDNLSIEHYKAKLIDPNSDLQIIPLSETYPSVVINSCRQYTIDTREFNIPSYPFGSYYSIEIELDDFIESIVVKVKEYNTTVEKIFNTSKVKTFFSNSDEYVFYKIIYRDNKPILVIELGSGKKGKYIPNSNIIIELRKTKGLAGNIGKMTLSQIFKGQIEITDYDKDSKELSSISNIISPNQLLTFDIVNGIGGEDVLSGDSLRKGLLQFIQSRDNLISELDFKNILSKYFKYSNFLFKKIYFQDNIMSIYVSFLNRYLQPIHTLSKNIDEQVFLAKSISSSGDIYSFYPEVEIEGKLFISPFLYKYDKFLNVYRGYLVLQEYVFSLNNIVKESLNELQLEPIFKLKLNFNYLDISTTFTILPIIEDPKFKYQINSVFVNEETKSVTFPGLMIEKIPLHVYVYNDSDQKLYDVKFNDVGLVQNTTDFLHLKKYHLSDSTIQLIDVPLVDKEEFLNDETFYLLKLGSQISSISLSETRLLSDDLQLKLINSYYIPQHFTKKVTIQQYDFNIFLPLIININLLLEKNYIISNNIDVLSSIVKLRLNIANYLNEKNSSSIKFYSSKLVDFIHTNNDWIKYVEIKLCDARNTQLTQSNIESIDQQLFISTFTKDEILNYCPNLWWFDINNLTINYSYLGD